MLEIKTLSKKFKQNEIFCNASMSVEYGNGVYLSGPNGAGKSTLLRMITGVITPDQGMISLDGDSIIKRKRSLSLCAPNGGGFYKRLTARQNLHYFGGLYGLSTQKTNAFIASQDLFTIDYWDTPVERLSTGMLQKANIIRAFLHDPQVLLFDEPLNSLDSSSCDLFLKKIDSWIREKTNRIFILVQHGLTQYNSNATSERVWRVENLRLVDYS